MLSRSYVGGLRPVLLLAQSSDPARPIFVVMNPKTDSKSGSSGSPPHRHHTDLYLYSSRGYFSSLTWRD
jgi:hypothetical protein